MIIGETSERTFSTTSVYKTPTHNSQSSARNNQNKKWGRFELKLGEQREKFFSWRGVTSLAGVIAPFFGDKSPLRMARTSNSTNPELARTANSRLIRRRPSECRLQAKEFYHDKLVLCSLRESDDEILRQNAADRDEFEFDFFDDREEWEDISLAASEVSFEMLGDGEGNQSEEEGEEEEEDGGRPRSFKDALLHGLHDTGRKELKICASA